MKEAQLVEAVEKKRMMVDGALSSREKAARSLLSSSVDAVESMVWMSRRSQPIMWWPLRVHNAEVGDWVGAEIHGGNQSRGR